MTRFIPACAGNSWTRAGHDYGLAVHPRVCGEQIFNNITLKKYGGSSPRVRGTVDAATWHLYRTRFIPACAGNSWS